MYAEGFHSIAQVSSIVNSQQRLLWGHYENTPMQYTGIFHSFKTDNFLMKNCDIFLIFAKHIGRGCTLEPPHLRPF